MKKYYLLLLLTGLLLSCRDKKDQNQVLEKIVRTEDSNYTAPEKLGWRLGSQAYTFKEFTFAEALDKLKSIDLKYVEAYPGQKIGGDIEGNIHHSMDANTRAKVKQLLDEKGIKLVCYGVVSGKDEAEWRSIFDFAKNLEIETITSEPAPEYLDLVESLCNEFGINLAIHNHPQPSRYWNPDTVLKALEGRSGRIGACADVGHWVRSGLNPVECLKKLEGKIISLHFKDLNQQGKEAHDVPWGTGISDVKAMLAELKRQNFKGVFSVEYEYNWKNSLPEIEQSVNYFNQVAAEL